MRHIPNIISILRILLVIPTVYFLAIESYGNALIVFLIAGLSDGLDGFLARRFAWTSHLGTYLDPMGDKLLMTASYFMLAVYGPMPIWLMVAVILRDAIIISGALFYRFYVEKVAMSALWISKVNTTFQILLVLLMIYGLSDFPYQNMISDTVIDIFIYIVLITTVWSGAAYIKSWWQRTLDGIQARQS